MPSSVSSVKQLEAYREGDRVLAWSLPSRGMNLCIKYIWFVHSEKVVAKGPRGNVCRWGLRVYIYNLI